MRNNLVLLGFLLGAVALYVIWESLTARIVAVESATGSYIYSEAEVDEEVTPSVPDVDMDALYARLDTLQNTASANAEAIESLLRRLERVEGRDTTVVSKVRSRETIYFAHDDSSLTSVEMAKINDVLVDIDDDAIVSLRGHADTVGDNRHNYLLSLRRASVVKRYMEEQLQAEGRIDTVLITIDGIGEESVVNVTADGVEEPSNRIVEILVFD